MYKISANGKSEWNIEKSGDDWLIDGKKTHFDLMDEKNGRFHVIKDGKTYQIEILRQPGEEKTFKIQVNGNAYELSVKDKMDDLLHELGMDTLKSKKQSEIKAPMPGLVLKVLVGEGAEVKKGDSLIILEAMKMENILKSPVNAFIRKISVNKGMAVEKNQVLMDFQ